ncbi:MAG: response regulator [Clostridiales bacterium]|nr:response regulator [Clostridiales bacterium]MCR5275693.1 response regulator [Clostridiales bacterium]
MLLEKKDAQRILLLIYFVTCVFFMILSANAEEYPEFFNIFCITTPVVAILLTHISKDNYKFQMYMMTTLYLLIVVLYGIYYKNPGTLQDGFMTVACVISLYFDFSANLYCLIFTAMYYAFWMVYDYTLLTWMSTPQELMVRILLLIIAQVFLMALVSFINRSKQTLVQKSQSTEDLLQIVEIKKKEAVAASQTKADFLASMSHEIRTPMNAIVGMTEMILRDDINPGVRENARNIKSAGNALLAIVNDILDFSKIESGKMEIINVRYQLTSVVNDIINIITVRMQDKNLDLVVNIDPHIPSELVGDEIRIRQILLNLLNNAVKFTSQGHITLKVAYQPVSSDMCLLHFDVSDTGMGIRPEDKQRLFGSFQRLDTRQNRAVEGTGLGLSICKRLMDLMGGTISVESEYGKGSTFSFELHQYIAKQKPMASVLEKKKEHVLYFDEKAIYRDQARLDLQRLGVSARFASAPRDLDPASNAYYSYFFVSKPMFDEFSHEIREFCSSHGNPKVVLMFDKNELSTGYKDVLVVRRPVYSAVFASVLTEKPIESLESDEFQETFIAPEAKILVVDDNAVNLKVVKGLLEPYQMHVFTAGSGKQCIEMLRDGQRFDMIYMDHMMPDLDGIDTLRIIRQMDDEYFRTVPVVALTANAVSGVREMFFKEGFQDYVSKPIELAQLEKSLKSNLPAEMIIRKQHTVASAPHFGEGDVQLRGVDCSKGLLNCGNNMDNYISLLKVVYEDGLIKIDRLRELAAAKDYAGYGIEAHALKSVAASIGAMDLSAMAKDHEFANYDGRFQFIDANYEDLLSSYQSLLDDIGLELRARGVIKLPNDSLNAEDEAPKLPITENELRQALINIRNSVEDFDQDSALQTLEWLMNFEMGPDVELGLKRTRNYLSDFQYDEAAESLNNLLGE